MSRKAAAKSDSSSALPAVAQVWIGALGIMVAGLIAYHNSFAGVFLLDEDKEILNNDAIRDLSDPIRILFATQRPLVNLTLAINYAFGGLRPGGYHFVNLIVHLVAALTLFGLVRRAVYRLPQTLRFTHQGIWLSLAVAAIWVVHPLNTQAVTYVIQRAESMMGMFYLLTLYGLVRGAERDQVDEQNGKWWYVTAVGACAMGMATKPVMVTAPVVALLFDRAFLGGSFAEALRRRWKVFLGLAATWGVLGGLGVLDTTFGSAPRQGAAAGFSFGGITPLEYALTQLWAICTYLRLSVFPYPLVFDYGWPIIRDSATLIVCGAIVFALLLFTGVGLWRNRWWGFVGAAFFLLLAPTSSFIPIRDTIFEHRMYLPLACVVILVAAGVQSVLRTCVERGGLSPSTRRTASTSLCALVVLVLCTLTIRRNRLYHSEIVMWQDVVAKRPDNPRAQDTLGTFHDFRGRADLAIPFYRRALELKPDYVNPRFNLATALIAVGQVSEGIAEYRHVLELDPAHLYVRLSLGAELVQRGDQEEGMALLREGVARNANDPVAHLVLGESLILMGDREAALGALRQAIVLRPGFIQARFKLAETLRNLGRTGEAISEYQSILRDEPQFMPARRALERLAPNR